MRLRYNPATMELEWANDPYEAQYDLVQQLEAARPKAPGAAQKLGSAAGSVAGLYAGSKIFGTGAAAAGEGPVAPVSTMLGASAAPQTALPSLSLMGGEGAASAAAAPSAAAAADAGILGAPSAAGAALNGAIAVGAPLLLGSLIDKTFFKQKPKRQYNAQEIAQDRPDVFNKLGYQIKGWDKADSGRRIEALNKLHDAKVLAMPGYADEQGNTKKRGQEYISWAKWLVPPSERNNMGRDGSGYRYTKIDYKPTEQEINQAVWLSKDKRQSLLDALTAMNSLGG